MKEICRSKGSLRTSAGESRQEREFSGRRLKAEMTRIRQRKKRHYDRIDAYKNRLAIRLRSQENAGTINLTGNNEPTDDRFLSIPWQKPPFKRFWKIRV